MSDCWVCNQKAEVKNEKLNALRQQATQQSMATGATMAIIQKSGCIYAVVNATEVNGHKVKEYINANSS